MEQVMNVRPLSIEDRSALECMDTGIQDDYVIRIFENLVESDNHELFGLFQNSKMLAIGGYSLFGGSNFAMLGRLRSDRRYLKKGNATELLKPIVDQLWKHPEVDWIGANTHLGNIPARRVLEKLGIRQGPVIHYLILHQPELLTGNTPGNIWTHVVDIEKKRELLLSLQPTPEVFPYECYYPLPYNASLFTKEYLKDSTFYVKPDNSRFVIIKNDTKKHQYSHVKYFWDDHYQQPGFFATLMEH
ncbi:GNAT family N-acetyltransferase, partial [Halobacillus sp. BBL2006]|uniref:GNAT family N-acetyltransferase n=1 Tax=Halobacillus sp. BBL2006 TaxID=1543706 RepID=UPI000541F5D2